MNHNRIGNNMGNAKAPYNFVPLNDKVLPNSAKSTFDSFDDLSGFIDLNMEAISPIFVRGTLTENDVKDNKTENEGHYKPANYKYKIPGSSIRGMLRTLYEIVTYSKMSFIDDYSLYFRSFADRSIELRDEYTRKMMGEFRGAYKPLVLAGYLVKNGKDYKIIKAESYHRVEEELVIKKKVFCERMSSSNSSQKNKNYVKEIKKTPYVKVFFKADPPTSHQHTQTKLYYSKINDISLTYNNGLKEGYIVLSGWIPSRRIGKHMHWVIGERTKDEYPVNKDLIENYKKDINRDSINLLESPDTPWGKPCFFILDANNNVQAFGHTGLFRLIYDNSIGKLRPSSHINDRTDMAEALFGKVSKNNTIAGRVYFEDAVATKVEEDIQRSPKILSSPKPNSFQLYLTQNPSEIRRNRANFEGIKNYNSKDAQLAGNKLYWHRDHENNSEKWYEEDSIRLEKYKTQYTKIKALKAGTQFVGRIRFENLNKFELGALLTIIDLPEGCYHKLGMAKALGLGSTYIVPSLTIIDRKERYMEFKSLGFKSEGIDSYKKDFNAVLDFFLKLETNSIWDIPRLKELKAMLDFQNKPNNSETRYMEIQRPDNRENEYRNRTILKKPSELTK